MRNCAAVQSKAFNIGQTLHDAMSLHRQGRLREAEKLYARALKAAPDNFDALHLLGLTKAQSGDMREACRLMSSAVKINPNVPDALVNLANVLHALERDGEALDCLDRALAVRPGDLDAILLRGNTLVALKRPADAVTCFQAVLEHDSQRRDALLGRGIAYAMIGAHAEALADFDAMLVQTPGDPEANYNRGTALLALGRYGDALTAFDRAIASAPTHIKAWNNRGRALQALNRHEEATACFRQALTLDRNYADAHFNNALSLLALGRLKEGFSEYEWRWKRTGMADLRRKYRGRLWLGEFPLDRRTILLTAEQGLGDTIQFVRYVPLLARSGTTVVLEVQPELQALLGQMSGVSSCIARGESLPRYDVYCPLGSLPHALKTEAELIPADIPYLQADAARIAKWRPSIEALPGKRIAIAWAGHAQHANDRNRSIDLRLLESLFGMEGVSFVSIQRELRSDDATVLESHGITSLGPGLVDMADTAAVTASVDLTIAVDTSVAHLAGAMGRPVWVMLPFSPDWRWTAAGERSPWYPQARLYRQRAIGDWPNVIASVVESLRGSRAD
ncbi:MAG TPA: tetratricopeptide repeat protein [Pseudolabrys sp.]|nr:tetratricopeptide repeat protein [Pseudolabrys sp.]